MRKDEQERADFGLVVQQFRERYGMTQQELAHMLRCDVTSIRYWESGRRTPRHPKVYKDFMNKIKPEQVEQSLDFYRRMHSNLPELG